MSCRAIRCSASAAETGARAEIGLRLAIVPHGWSIEMPRSTARRMSPSVRKPTSLPSSEHSASPPVPA